MIRKNLFIGLTIMLGVILIYLVFQAREEEKEVRARSTEIIQKSKPSRTRVLLPRDLQITESRMDLAETLPEPDSESSGLTATHGLTIRNVGKVWYHDPLLEISYLDRRDKLLEHRNHTAQGEISPGTSLRFEEFLLTDIPAGTASCTLRILYSDITTAASREEPQDAK
jgi:hypothetical protein